jgi:hypothetical protein
MDDENESDGFDPPEDVSGFEISEHGGQVDETPYYTQL